MNRCEQKYERILRVNQHYLLVKFPRVISRYNGIGLVPVSRSLKPTIEDVEIRTTDIGPNLKKNYFFKKLKKRKLFILACWNLPARRRRFSPP